jgi:PAS domain S-box-containing protein
VVKSGTWWSNAPNWIQSNRSSIVLVFRISVVVCVVEAVIMLASTMVPVRVQVVLDEYPLPVILLDIIFLTLVSSPIIYGWVIRPFVLAGSKAESHLALKDGKQHHGFLFAHLPQSVVVEDYSEVKKVVDQLLLQGIQDLKAYLIKQPVLVRELVAKARLLDANHAMLVLYGYSSVEHITKVQADISSWWNDGWLDYYSSEIASFVAQKSYTCEVTDFRVDGSEFSTRTISSVVEGYEDTWKRVLNLHEDISVRREREEMLLSNQRFLQRSVKDRTRELESALSRFEQSEAFLIQCAELATLGYAVWDCELERDIVVSKELAKIHGLTVGDYRNIVTSTEKYVEFVVLDDREKYIEYENTEMPIGDRAVESVEYRIRRADGEIRYVQQRSQPIHSASGQKDLEIVIIQDITALKHVEIRLEESERLRIEAAKMADRLRGQQEVERKKAAAQLIQSSKLATLGEMATSVAHELNQPLNVIRMAAGNTRRKLSEGIADPEYLNDKLLRIEEQTARAAVIIDHMRMFGRKAKERPELIDLRNVVKNALDLMGEQLRLAGIEVVTVLPEDCACVLGHIIQMEQVILNLLTNALDAIEAVEQSEGGAKITLRVFECDNVVHITAQDTGGGISGDGLHRIFEPFYTTKQMGKGTGLGLSVSYGIVRDMKGTIAAENIGDGARFTITLPMAR